MTLSLQHIRSFDAVARTGSMLGAARDLGLAQPTVGRHIDSLEASLGLTLFTRGREGMRLTAKGTDLVATAADVMQRADAFERLAAGLEESVVGSIRLSANEIFGALLLPNLIADFMATHPSIAIEVDVSNTASNLLRRDADIAVRMFRPIQNDLVARKIGDLPMGLFAHESYLARRPAPRSLLGLSEHVLIGQDRDRTLIAAFATAGFTRVPDDFSFRSDNDVATIGAVRAGIGIGPLHRGMAERWPGLVQVLPEIDVPPLELWLACHADVRHNKRIRLLMDHLAQSLKSPYAGLAA